jgi:hypothetical protein
VGVGSAAVGTGGGLDSWVAGWVCSAVGQQQLQEKGGCTGGLLPTSGMVQAGRREGANRVQHPFARCPCSTRRQAAVLKERLAGARILDVHHGCQQCFGRLM